MHDDNFATRSLRGLQLLDRFFYQNSALLDLLLGNAHFIFTLRTFTVVEEDFMISRGVFRRHGADRDALDGFLVEAVRRKAIANAYLN
eukprot:CAMPEP_0183334618 /NCGR_PEP_ID=MMETSP0164_2-20130417/3177_1 /TAXON_ID=221442 /ORGANISM="Coccolithus pelagicus ssp braarudi, Strain PLY182g" /LENGTH=87 /DNA_ID=CAMNT_0025503799 /DNA_START=255 /DNA_END=515 /DNA_ORIENTATION=+